jgi:hypothetical protein
VGALRFVLAMSVVSAHLAFYRTGLPHPLNPDVPAREMQRLAVAVLLQSGDPSKNRYLHVPERNRLICARYDEGRASGLTLTDLGKEFGVSRTIVGSVIR